MTRLAVLLACVEFAGCALGVQGTVGPVVRDVRLGEDGRLLVERCDVVNGVALRNCRRQSAAPGEALPAWEAD